MSVLKSLGFIVIGCIALNSYAATLDVTDTLYHFAKKCNGQGKTAYFKDDTGRWNAYAANQIHQEYMYMLEMTSYGSLSNDSAPSVSSKDIQTYLNQTRAKRLQAAQPNLKCI